MNTIVLLCSGELGCKILEKAVNDYSLVAVCTDNRSYKIIRYCQDNLIPIFIGNPRNNRGSAFLSLYSFEFLISVNYLFLIEVDMLQLATKMNFNIHGSLLPKYRGRTPHVWAIINGEKITGITAHIINEGCDTGEILDQIEIPIEPQDTGNDILIKFSKCYYPLFSNIIACYNEGTLTLKRQNEKIATFFGKRTPDDGRICWFWSRERIKNWVRAQSNPYPGAFSYHKKTKITIDEISFSDHGYHFKDVNGMVLSGNPLIIKCSNGAIEVKTIRENNVKFKTGDILS